MRIGILTFHDGVNHGSFLQAYCLQRFLASNGVQTEIIDYRTPRRTVRELAHLLLKPPREALGNIRKIRAFTAFHARLRTTPLCRTAARIDQLAFDTVICGSDEIWNYRHPIYGYDPIFFGTSLTRTRLVAYAASCGNARMGSDAPEAVMVGLRRFDRISVRDQHTHDVVSRLVARPVTLAQDPLLIHDSGQELGRYPVRHERYLLLYSPVPFGPEREREIAALAARERLALVSVGYHHAFAAQNLPAVDPFEWLSLFRDAELIVTTTFHGSIAAVKCCRPFCTLRDPGKANKIRTALGQYRTGDRILEEIGGSIEAVLAKPLDAGALDALLEEKIEASRRYLLESLRG